MQTIIVNVNSTKFDRLETAGYTVAYSIDRHRVAMRKASADRARRLARRAKRFWSGDWDD